MTLLFNNCRNRDHARYGAGAFYELALGGPWAMLPQRLRPGDTCIVVSHGEAGLLVFDWYRFAHEKRMLAEGGLLVRVLFGRQRRSEALVQARAAAIPPYAHLFDRHGNFKIAPVLRINEVAAPSRTFSVPATA